MTIKNLFVNQRGQPRWMLFFSLVLAALLMVLAFRGVNWESMLDTLRNGDLSLLLLGFAMLSVSYFLRGMRWRILLSVEKPLPPLMVFWGTCVGYLGNSFLPARAGELLRSVLIGQRGGISKSLTIATAITERLIDSLALVVFALLALPALPIIPDWFANAQRGMAGIGIVGLAVVIFLPRFDQLIVSTLMKLPLPESIRPRLGGIVERFLQGMGAFQNVQRGLGFFGLTILIWLIDVLVAVTIANAFQLALTPAEALLLLASLGLASAIPSTPGYLGIYQFIAVSLLPLFGFERVQALAYILAFQAVTYAVVIVWGSIGLWQLSRMPTPAVQVDLA